MAAIIEAVATSVSHRPLWPKGALRLADDAISECLHRGGRRPEELNLLINVGVYREKNLAEPALAAMIQEDIGANPGHPPQEHAHGTFSFDVANGGCGVVTALELMDGFVQSGTIQLGVVVASDSNPDGAADFPFPNAGGALLLRPGSAEVGFQGFRSETFPELADAFRSSVGWEAQARRFAGAGQNVLTLTVRDDYAALALEVGLGVSRRLIAAHGLGPRDIDLIVASTFPETFAKELAHGLERPLECLALPAPALTRAHTAGVVAALEPAMQSGRFAASRHVLFVSVGAGITAAAALYRAS